MQLSLNTPRVIRGKSSACRYSRLLAVASEIAESDKKPRELESFPVFLSRGQSLVLWVFALPTRVDYHGSSGEPTHRLTGLVRLTGPCAWVRVRAILFCPITFARYRYVPVRTACAYMCSQFVCTVLRSAELLERHFVFLEYTLVIGLPI